MENHMGNRQGRGTYQFRNPSLPNDLTEILRKKIEDLPSSVKTDYLKSQIFSKYVSKDTDPPQVRATRAEFKWLCAERDNEATTDRLILTPEEYQILPRVTYRRFMDHCRGVIARIIGEYPPVDALIGSFSGGASTSRSRTDSHPASKYVGKAHVTQRLKDSFYRAIYDEIPLWFWEGLDFNYTVEVVPGNVMFTVPKKTDIDRVAAKEPDINMFVQKGSGDYFRRRLRQAGIDLNDQSRNRDLARIGSLDGSLATLDLSSASDSVTTELVFQLLPSYWFTLLDSARSHTTKLLDGGTHRNQMFSSMGNGFTFELESLLFYALMRTTAYLTGTPGVVSIYGDDIIIPTEMADLAVYVLNYFGFQVNPDKSFVEGPFRESCGGHYHLGVDITPFYVKGPIETIPDVIHVANSLREWARSKTWEPCQLTEPLDPDVEEIWLWLKGFVPRILWGGADTSFKYQLVSNDVPISRLYEEHKKKDAGYGGYLHWLNATWARTEVTEAVVTSRHSVSRNRFRVRPVRDRTVPRLAALFSHEFE